MDKTELRELDIKLAKSLGFFVNRGALYAPMPEQTLLGGSIDVHMLGKPVNPEIEAQIWQDYTPRFTTRMDEAMWLLQHLLERHYVEYNLFLENDMKSHTAEIGHWAQEPHHSDKTVWANEDTPSLAICKAVEKLLEKMPYMKAGESDGN